MSDELQKKIFSKNLNKYISRSGKKQNEIAADIKVIPQTLNSWCTGQAMPRIGKIQLLADYFGINKSDLLEEKEDIDEEGYYLDDDARDMAQFLYENPDYKVLFDASRKVKKEDIQFVKEMIDRMSNKND
jgi:transcriptional regulator with XRE-family HTH domain